MKLIKSQPRYRCDFCKHTGTKASMNRHERICFFNPNRESCSPCSETGWIAYSYESVERCQYCLKFYEFLLNHVEIGRFYHPVFINGITEILCRPIYAGHYWGKSETHKVIEDLNLFPAEFDKDAFQRLKELWVKQLTKGQVPDEN